MVVGLVLVDYPYCPVPLLLPLYAAAVAAAVVAAVAEMASSFLDPVLNQSLLPLLLLLLLLQVALVLVHCLKALVPPDSVRGQSAPHSLRGHLQNYLKLAENWKSPPYPCHRKRVAPRGADLG